MIKKDESSILVQILKRDNYTQKEHELLYSSIKKYVGEEVEVLFEFVEAFEPLKNGKRCRWKISNPMTGIWKRLRSCWTMPDGTGMQTVTALSRDLTSCAISRQKKAWCRCG